MSSYHGRGRRDRRDRGRTFPSFSEHSALPSDRNILEGLSTSPLQTISKPSSGCSEEVKITDLEYVGSYNWLGKPTPTIVVPGSPPWWTNRATPYQVHPDDGIAFKDQNGFRSPNSVLQPLIVAVDQVSKADSQEFNWGAIDFVTDRNNLRKLLRWVSGNANKDFRIDMQLAGKTILLNRWENRYKEQMSGLTFGFNFEKASTSPAPGCEGSTGHHRIVRYNLNGLAMVVRFEVDACVNASSAIRPPRPANVDDLIGGLSRLTLPSTLDRSESPSWTHRSESPSWTHRSESPLWIPPTPATSGTFPNIITILTAGSIVPQSSIVELTTRSTRNASFDDWKENYPQLFLSQTPHHFLAVHERGRFKEVHKRKLDSDELRNVAADLQGDLKVFRRVLDVLKELAVKHGERARLSLVCRGGELQVYERTSQASCLPDDLLQKFDL